MKNFKMEEISTPLQKVIREFQANWTANHSKTDCKLKKNMAKFIFKECKKISKQHLLDIMKLDPLLHKKPQSFKSTPS